jgi:colanic acid/amylovoran biosynthesis protein
MRPRVVFTHVYSFSNKGDAAILAGQIQDLRHEIPDLTVDILTLDYTDVGSVFEGAPVHPSLMAPYVRRDRGRVTRFFGALAMMLTTLTWAFIRRFTKLSIWLPRTWRAATSLLDDADVVIGVGGGYLRGVPGLASTFQLLLLLHQVVLVRTLGKPVLLPAQSFGPFYGSVQRGAFKQALKGMHDIYPREQKSADLLRSYGFQIPADHNVADAAFLFTPEPRPNMTHPFPAQWAGREVVGVTVRQWLSKHEQDAYEAAMAGLCQHLLDAGYAVALIPQVTSDFHGDDDRLVGIRISSYLPETPYFANLDSDFDVHEIYAIYSSLTLLVGTRFHSVIFALRSNVPAMAIEYEHKTSGILTNLGLAEWHLRIEGLQSADLVDMFERLNDQRAVYLEQLARALPDYVATGHVPTKEVVRLVS